MVTQNVPEIAVPRICAVDEACVVFDASTPSVSAHENPAGTPMPRPTSTLDDDSGSAVGRTELSVTITLPVIPTKKLCELTFSAATVPLNVSVTVASATSGVGGSTLVFPPQPALRRARTIATGNTSLIQPCLVFLPRCRAATP